MPNNYLVTADQKRAAWEHIVRAINILQAPQNGSTFGSSMSELIVLAEPNRKAAVRSLLAAIAQLVPADHPDVQLRAEAEKWMNSYTAF